MSEYLFTGMDSYDTPENIPVSFWFKVLRRWYFYLHDFGTFIESGKMAGAGKLDKDGQIRQSGKNIRLIERCGGHFCVRGLNHLAALEGRPVVIVANHMSLLETAVMHALIREHLDFSFVIKESLLKVPYFRDILKMMNAIPVTRHNPREDLKTVLTQGRKVLEAGRSMIVFPQSTRTKTFDPEQFNSIGVKLAKSAGVPVVPLALKTDFLETGRWLRDLGPVHPRRMVRFEFGEAIPVTGNGQEQQRMVVNFIESAFDRWHRERSDS